MKNYMKDVAKLLDVELGEEFRVFLNQTDSYVDIMLTEKGVKKMKTNLLMFDASINILEWLLCGHATIQKIPSVGVDSI